MAKFSVKKPFTVFVAVVICLILGFVSFTRMSTDLLPDFSLPYVVVITTYAGASPDKVESTVTEPLESGLGTVNGVVNVTSTSSENYSMVMLEFEEDANMDSAMVKLSTAMDLIDLPDGTGTPMLMEVSMDMLPVMYTSVDYEDMDIYELSSFVEETVVPDMERQDGVASVSTMGLISESVEIRLDQDKIDAVNDKLAAYVNEELADAKQQITDAQDELADAKQQLDDAEKELEEQQTTTSNELAETSLLVDQAVATQAAYSAELNSLQASKAALEMEKQAYIDAGLVDTTASVSDIMSYLVGRMQSYDMDTSDLPESVEDAIENPEKAQNLVDVVQEIQDRSSDDDSVVSHMTELGDDLNSEEMSDMLGDVSAEQLTQLLEIELVRMPQISTELANLDTEILAAQTVLDNVNDQVSEAVDNYSALEAGKIEAAAGFGSGAAQIAAGKTSIESGEEQLEQAMEAYENGRDQALENANLDALTSIETLSGLIYAQNFAMPAGYIYEDEEQYLLKVGDEFADKEELENTLLCNIDGVGDVHLCDVADVTWIDNAGESYTKVNGNDAVVVTISKASTAGTSDVSDTCNEEWAELEELYPGLHATNLMDQGDYIDLIVSSVLKNLIYGAILAIIVLALFLRSVKPTLVVAFSIPLSVLVAIVLMYFSGITLNIISLSGLALGIGMLVDNSIVVLENIYRLRGLGVPAARAAVMGAKQVAGAIAASTLTTICVFFPIVFTSGIVKELFVDMALTIAYSLVASLLIALTVVPCMSANLLKNTEPKEQVFMNRVYDVYEKALRFCLKKKYVPITIAVALLAICGIKATRTGLILFPSMGGEQMSVSMSVNPDLSREEAFEIADDAMEQMQAIEGVEYVGMMSGSDDSSSSVSSMLTSTGGSHDLTVYLLLDDKTAKDNSVVADQLEEMCLAMDLEDYTISTSNMDFSSYMESGLTVNIYGSDNETLLDISEDVMQMVGEIEGFEDISNGQEEADRTIELTIDKDAAMRNGLTIAQIVSELATNLTTEATATTLTVDGEQYDVTIVNENDAVSVDDLMDYEFETEVTNEDGETETEVHYLKEFASMQKGESLASISRENQKNYISVTATTGDGYNTTLLSRTLEEKLESYEAPEGYTIEISGEMEEIYDALSDMFLMISLAIVFIYLIMVAQFQSLLSPFIVIFTIPLAFTGGLLGIYISGEEISLVSLMGFLMLAGVIVNNGIVFVDYANQLRLEGMDKREALVETGRNRMRPILMTMLTTVLAMCTMVFSTDAAAAMSRGMAVVVIGGLLYATLMTLFIVPVLYDLFFRKDLKRVDIGTDEELDQKI